MSIILIYFRKQTEISRFTSYMSTNRMNSQSYFNIDIVKCKLTTNVII